MSDSILLKAAAKYVLVIQVILSLFFLFRGHNLPGGGFIGGLLAASAFALDAMAFDVSHSRRRLKIPPEVLAGLGLLCAVLSGTLSLFRGEEFMKGLWGQDLWLPTIGKVGLGTPLLFDLGVYLAVLGVTTSVVFNLFERGYEDFGPNAIEGAP